MGSFTVANLEAEFGCLDGSLLDVAPRCSHGPPNTFFEPPPETLSRLSPPSKTKSLYPFGEDGVLAWATPAGELYHTASCNDNRLICVESKRSIEKGDSYRERGRMLEKVVKLPQGSGYGIGLSLAPELHPSNVSWVHNRWPRFTYEYMGLDISLQYIIDSKSKSVIQQYLIRNNSSEKVSLPYIVSSDVSFREHEDIPQSSHNISSGKNSERLLLFNNTEVLVGYAAAKVRLRMSVFLNAQRLSVWANMSPSEIDEEATNDCASQDTMAAHDNRETEDLENEIRDWILASNQLDSRRWLRLFILRYTRYFGIIGQPPLLKRAEKNFAKHRYSLVIPENSTQELCAIIQVSNTLRPEIESKGDAHASHGVKIASPLSERQTDLIEAKILEKRLEMYAALRTYFMEVGDAGREDRALELARNFINIGKACAKVENIGEARLYYYVACLVVESAHREGAFVFSHTYFRYAKFLEVNKWHAEALKIMNRQLDTLNRQLDMLDKRDLKYEKILNLYKQIRDRVASVYLKNAEYKKAKAMYEIALSQLQRDKPSLAATAAQYRERIAFAQVHQQEYKAACSNYERLLKDQSSHHQTILSNLGFLQRRLGRFQEAKSFFERAINASGSDGSSGVTHLHAQSGLFSCLTQLGTELQTVSQISQSFIPYMDINFSLSGSTRTTSPFEGDSLDFALSRQLESLLSICSIPVSGESGISGIALVDADPLNACYEGRGAYFQFRSLIQYQRHIDATRDGVNHLTGYTERIKTTCKSHLIWVFRIAQSDGTWRNCYSVSGGYKPQEDQEPSGNIAISRSIEGAFNFLKVCLYFETWRKDWEFVLELLHKKLNQWLKYLTATQHMSNLWADKLLCEFLKPDHDDISASNEELFKAFPQYHLSDSALVWLALSQLEQLLSTIQKEFSTLIKKNKDAESMIEEIRMNFDSLPQTTNHQGVQSNIIKTFKIPKGELRSHFTDNEKNLSGSVGRKSYNNLDDAETSSSKRHSNPDKQLVADRNGRSGSLSQANSDVIVLQRTIHDYTLEIQALDTAVIEASIYGLFKRTEDDTELAWQETLNIQKRIDAQTFSEPRHMALSLLAYRLNMPIAESTEDDVQKGLYQKLSAALYDSGVFAQSLVKNEPEPMRSWSASSYETLSLCLGGRFDQCTVVLPLDSSKKSPGSRPQMAPQLNELNLSRQVKVEMPHTVESRSRMSEKYVIDSAFLPDWMYFYPDVIHLERWNCTINGELKRFEKTDIIKFLEPAVEQLKGKSDFNDIAYKDLPLLPAVVDSGFKRSSNPQSSYTRRQGAVKQDLSPGSLWDHLTQPRLIQIAKKRLIEISSQDRISALICLLLSPQEERPHFSQFLCRHESSDDFFGECVDWKMNIWYTELHLAFYQLVNGESKDPTSMGSNFGGALRTRNIPSLLGTSHPRKITPVVLSFRFVGDLRDRIWTCTFISSATSSAGFKGFSHAGDWGETITAEEQAQRRLLELSYVERMLLEMSSGIGSILAAFQRELDVPESRDPQSESFEFIYSYSTLYLKSGEILRDVRRRVESLVQTVEQWERREETRGLRSRWSNKDEERYGKRVKDLTQKCKAKLQEIRTQHKRLDEQRTFAEQRHNNLVSYMQLREARTSTRSAEDVRLFTYVTIIFLPLTFSSSLFSMQAAPQASTVSVMVQTTTVALAVTILFLSNLRTLDRNWSFYLNKLNAKALTRMKASKHPWALDWHKKQRELEEVAQRRISKMDYAKPLQAESKWWYFLFWLTYALRVPRALVLDGIAAWNKRQKVSLLLIGQMLLAFCFGPVCVIIFVIQFSSVTTVDFVVVVWLLVRSMSRSLGLSQSEDKGDDAERSTGVHSTFVTISNWLRSPPRPLDTIIHGLKAGQSKAALPQSPAPTGQSPKPSSDTPSDIDKAWALAVKDDTNSEDESRFSTLEMPKPVGTGSDHPGVANRNSSQLKEMV